MTIFGRAIASGREQSHEVVKPRTFRRWVCCCSCPALWSLPLISLQPMAVVILVPDLSECSQADVGLFILWTQRDHAFSISTSYPTSSFLFCSESKSSNFKAKFSPDQPHLSLGCVKSTESKNRLSFFWLDSQTRHCWELFTAIKVQPCFHPRSLRNSVILTHRWQCHLLCGH